MAKKVFTDESLETLINETKSYVDDAASKKANTSHTHSISNITNLQSTLDSKASTAVATQSSNGLLSAEDKIQLDNGGTPIATTSGDGAAYTVTVDGITTLTNGMEITIIPHVNSSTTQPTLNVNGLGAKYIRMPITYNTSATSVGALNTWLVKSKPITIQYDGAYWKTISMPRPSAQYLYGSVPIANGGTGATDAATAISNLGAMDLSSAQTASGIKTFTNGVKIGTDGAGISLTFDSTESALVISFI